MQSWREIIADAVQRSLHVRELKEFFVGLEREVREQREKQLAEIRLAAQ
jgi:hypothetical protein